MPGSTPPRDPLDAIIGFWDFPVSSLAPLLRKCYGVPSTTLS